MPEGDGQVLLRGTAGILRLYVPAVPDEVPLVSVGTARRRLAQCVVLAAQGVYVDPLDRVGQAPCGSAPAEQDRELLRGEDRHCKSLAPPNCVPLRVKHYGRCIAGKRVPGPPDRSAAMAASSLGGLGVATRRYRTRLSVIALCRTVGASRSGKEGPGTAWDAVLRQRGGRNGGREIRTGRANENGSGCRRPRDVGCRHRAG